MPERYKSYIGFKSNYNYNVSIGSLKHIEGSNFISSIPQDRFDRLLQVYFQKPQSLNQQNRWIQALITKQIRE